MAGGKISQRLVQHLGFATIDMANATSLAEIIGGAIGERGLAKRVVEDRGAHEVSLSTSARGAQEISLSPPGIPVEGELSGAQRLYRT
jgi:hypothetical protein